MVTQPAAAAEKEPTRGRAHPGPVRDGLDPHGRLEFPLGGFLVRTGDRVVLVDTGAGAIDTGQYKGGRLVRAEETGREWIFL